MPLISSIGIDLIPQEEYVIANDSISARIYLAIPSFTVRHNLNSIQKLLAELREVDPDFINAKIYQKVTGVQEIE